MVLLGRETILRNGEPVGYLTSGGFGYTIGMGIGYGYVKNPHAVTDDWLAEGTYELVVATERTPARIALRPFYDPENLRIRS
jgi:4-methylaminobutanoate oxidase (formaldehyde-forming)